MGMIVFSGAVFVLTLVLGVSIAWHYWAEARYSGKEFLDLYALAATADPMELICLTWYAIGHDDSQDRDARMYLVLTRLVINPRVPLEALLVLRVVSKLRESQCPQVQLLLRGRLRD